MAGQVEGDWEVTELQADTEGVPPMFGLIRKGMDKPEYMTQDRDLAEREKQARNRALRGIF